jgi:hypothetical protein
MPRILIIFNRLTQPWLLAPEDLSSLNYPTTCNFLCIWRVPSFLLNELWSSNHYQRILRKELKKQKKKTKKMKRQHHFAVIQFSYIFLFITSSQWNVLPQNLPPLRYDGFVYENRKGGSDSILIEAFFDPVCPDSRDTWPPLQKALKHYGSRVSLVVHLLPLPSVIPPCSL